MSSAKTTWLVLVALAEAKLPAPEAVQAALQRQGSEGPLPELASETEAMVTLQWGEATVAYTLVEQPIPELQLAGPCSVAWYWPQAAQEFAGHQAHLLVTLVDEGRDAITKSIRLTQLTMAIAQCTPAVGILWGPAGTVHQPAAFAEQAQQMSPEDLPLYLWIDFRIQANEEGLSQIFTNGLEAFDRQELEVEPCPVPPQQLLSDVYNVVHYALTDPSAIKDADTIGLADGRQMRAEHQESRLADGRQVIRLKYDAAG